MAPLFANAAIPFWLKGSSPGMRVLLPNFSKFLCTTHFGALSMGMGAERLDRLLPLQF